MRLRFDPSNDESVVTFADIQTLVLPLKLDRWSRRRREERRWRWTARSRGETARIGERYSVIASACET